jgi:hypothetical protein
MTMYLSLFNKRQHDIIYQHTSRETCFMCANYTKHKQAVLANNVIWFIPTKAKDYMARNETNHSIERVATRRHHSV